MTGCVIGRWWDAGTVIITATVIILAAVIIAATVIILAVTRLTICEAIYINQGNPPTVHVRKHSTHI